MDEPNKFYLTMEDLENWWIPKAEEQVRIFKHNKEKIEEYNECGGDIYDETFKIGDLVECEWSNGVVKYGIVKEFASTFDGRIFPILFECTKDYKPKKKMMSGTFLDSGLLKVKKHKTDKES